jgi:hypothetical protein
VITFFTIPKPFEGHIGVIQRNALRSWLRVAPGVQVIAIGEAPEDIAVENVPDVARNEYGTPLLDDAFRIAESRAQNDVLCYCNTDILLPQSLARALAATRRVHERFLLVGECWNVAVTEELDTMPPNLPGEKRGADAIDYFVYSRGVFGELPPFAVGRTVFDNWLVWRARDQGATVVDVTSAVRALHQDHSYGHGGTLGKVRSSPEALENRRLLGGGRERLYSRFDATHRLVGDRLVPNPLGLGHLGETARRAWAKLGYTLGLRQL